MKLALGTAQFGLNYGIANIVGQLSEEAVTEVLAVARESDIDTIDTAAVYGDAESRLGRIGSVGFRIVTKLPAPTNDIGDLADWVERQVEASLERLGANRFHAVLLHRPLEVLTPAGRRLAEGLRRLKDQRLADKVGVSIYDPAELTRLEKVVPLDLVQAPFSIVDRRLASTGWIDTLKLAGTEIHVRSTFLQGLLLMPRDALPQRFAPWHELWNRWHDWLAEVDLPPARACLDYVRSHAGVDRIVVGVDSAAQLRELIAATASEPVTDFPDIGVDEPRLINPMNWNDLT